MNKQKIDIDTVILTGLILFAGLYLTWHFGRAYEREAIYKALPVQYTDYELPEFTESGRPEPVNCVLDSKMKAVFPNENIA